MLNRSDTIVTPEPRRRHLAFPHERGEDNGGVALWLQGGGGTAQLMPLSRIRWFPTATTRRWRRRMRRAVTRTRRSPAQRLALDVDNRPRSASAPTAWWAKQRRAARQHRGELRRRVSSTRPDASFNGTDMVPFRAIDAAATKSGAAAMIVITIDPVKDAHRSVQGAPLGYVENQDRCRDRRDAHGERPGQPRPLAPRWRSRQAARPATCSAS